jgi:hypothetical protein
MKTTIDLPEPLYRQAKIRAVQTGQTLKHLVIASLSREMTTPVTEEGKSFGERRQLLPEFNRAMKAGAYRPAPGARDITEMISEDRDAR